MPLNAASGSSCTIHLLHPPPSSPSTSASAGTTATPCAEYNHQTTVDPATGAIQETVTIESQQACPFQIALDVKPTARSRIRPQFITDPQLPVAEDCICSIYLDGIYVATHMQPRCIGASQLPIHIGRIVSHDWSTSRSLQFAAVNLVDPDDESPANKICQDENVIKALGTIRIDVFRASLVYVPRMAWNGPSVSTSNQMQFSERSKKACLATTAGLSVETQLVGPLPTMRWYPQATDATPFLQFIFKYKPRAILEAQGTIPQAVPQVEPAAEKENNPNRKHRNNKRIKNEDGDESAPKRAHKVIDLTGSDDI